MLELFTLGRVDLKMAPAEAESAARGLLRQPKAFALLVYLAVNESFMRRDRVAAMFWPDLDEAHARNALSRTLSRIADAVGRDVVVTRGAAEIGVAPAGVWCDASELERLAGRSDTEALALFHGEFLDGWHLPGLSEFGHWLEARRLKLRELVVRSARRVAADRDADGDLTRAVDALQLARTLAPASEVVTRELMALLDRQGEGAAALELYAAASAWLRREIGAGPQPATRHLAEAIRARIDTPSAAPAAAVQAAADTSPASTSAIRSLAVLPFANLTGDPDQEYFADGMADALITQLARLNAFRVISRQSTLRFRQSDRSITDIAAALGVDGLIEGTVARSGDRVRVGVQLVHARPERHLWAGAYERPLFPDAAITSPFRTRRPIFMSDGRTSRCRKIA